MELHERFNGLGTGTNVSEECPARQKSRKRVAARDTSFPLQPFIPRFSLQKGWILEIRYVKVLLKGVLSHYEER